MDGTDYGVSKDPERPPSLWSLESCRLDDGEGKERRAIDGDIVAATGGDNKVPVESYVVVTVEDTMA